MCVFVAKLRKYLEKTGKKRHHYLQNIPWRWKQKQISCWSCTSLGVFVMRTVWKLACVEGCRVRFLPGRRWEEGYVTVIFMYKGMADLMKLIWVWNMKGKVDEMERQDRLKLFCGGCVLCFSCCTVCGAIVKANKRVEVFLRGNGTTRAVMCDWKNKLVVFCFIAFIVWHQSMWEKCVKNLYQLLF